MSTPTTENGHTPLTEAQIRETIAGVEEPEIGRGLVELNMVPGARVTRRDLHLTVDWSVRATSC